eukprot:229460-Alexandrium_andersonii.AAC.1
MFPSPRALAGARMGETPTSAERDMRFRHRALRALKQLRCAQATHGSTNNSIKQQTRQQLKQLRN